MLNKKMTLEELEKLIDVLPGTKKIVKNIEEKYEKEILFMITEKFDSYAEAKVKIANTKRDNHLLIIGENKLEHANYLIAHECMHINRMMAADKEDKKLITFKQKGMLKLDEMEHMMVSGVLRQIYNIPIDIKIERHIFENYPSLRKIQRICLEASAEQLLSACHQDISQIPANLRKYVNMSLAISYVYLESLTPILGMGYKKSYKKHWNVVKLAKSIKNLKIEDVGGKEDVKQVTLWAKHLDMEDFIGWILLDNVPTSYYQSY